MKRINKAYHILKKDYPNILVTEKDDCLVLEGELEHWDDVVSCGKRIAEAKICSHVINKIHLKGYQEKPMKVPSVEDTSLEGRQVDVLVIGGGVIGSAVLRELSKYDLSCMLVEKEEDLAMAASGRNDGCIHIGIDLHQGSSKLYYLQRAVKMFPELCHDLQVEYKTEGQTVAFTKEYMKVAKPYLRIKARKNRIPGLKILNRKKLLEIEPNLAPDIRFGAFFPSGGTVCPYNFTIALAESAVLNHAEVHLETYVKRMVVENHVIQAVITNRGTIYPKIVVNAAGVYSDVVADMADDQFYSIHPRKGTDSIMDKNVFGKLSKTAITVYQTPGETKKSHSKGGGIIPTVDGNTLVGPDAKEVPDREDYSTDSSSINQIFSKHHLTIEALNKGDIITYFSGIRAATYEEDFVVSKGKWTKNIIHAGGIQSPGLTAAPAIAEDIAKWSSELLGGRKKKKDFNPVRKGIVKTRLLKDEERDELIHRNPDYGVIVCRCEEISKGEIIDAMHSLIPPKTTDGVKRRVRAGMGRCQGGFCQPLVAQIMASELGVDIKDIKKKGEGEILFRDTK